MQINFFYIFLWKSVGNHGNSIDITSTIVSQSYFSLLYKYIHIHVYDIIYYILHT